jgi:hypothetical protein
LKTGERRPQKTVYRGRINQRTNTDISSGIVMKSLQYQTGPVWVTRGVAGHPVKIKYRKISKVGNPRRTVIRRRLFGKILNIYEVYQI